MGDTDLPKIPVPLPDDYKVLQGLAKAHGLPFKSVKKVALQAALCKIVEKDPDLVDHASGSADEQEGEATGEVRGAIEAPADGTATVVPCADCPDPAECTDGCQTDDEEDPDAETVVHVAGDRVPITRIAPNKAWTCPVCDHSNMDLVRACGGCGATRDGDEVVV